MHASHCALAAAAAAAEHSVRVLNSLPLLWVVELLLATPVQLYCGATFYRRWGGRLLQAPCLLSPM